MTIPINYQNGAGITQLQGTVYTPVTAYSGTVTFTSNSKTVTGVGTTFTSQFAPGQSISADGVSFYVVSTVSNLSITLTTAFGTGTATVSKYYEADCLAGQTCPQSVPFSVTGLSDSGCVPVAALGGDDGASHVQRQRDAPCGLADLLVRGEREGARRERQPPGGERHREQVPRHERLGFAPADQPPARLPRRQRNERGLPAQPRD